MHRRRLSNWLVLTIGAGVLRDQISLKPQVFEKLLQGLIFSTEWKIELIKKRNTEDEILYSIDHQNPRSKLDCT